MLCSQCTKTVKPVVVFDIDGTLGDYHRHFLQFAREYFGRYDLPSGYDGRQEFHEYLGLTLPEYRAAKLAYRQGGQKRSMVPYTYAIGAVESAILAGCEVWIATTRPFNRLDNIDPDTVEWCRRNGILFDGLLYGDDKYAQLAEHIDPERVLCIVDDLPEQVALANESFPKRGRLILRQHNSWTRSSGVVEIKTIEFDAFTRNIKFQASIWKEQHANQ